MKTTVDAWYGYGDVFLANKRNVKFLGRDIDYLAERVRKKHRGDWWIPIEVLVAVGHGVSPQDAIIALTRTVNEIKKVAKRRGQSRDQPRASFKREKLK